MAPRDTKEITPADYWLARRAAARGGRSQVRALRLLLDLALGPDCALARAARRELRKTHRVDTRKALRKAG